MLEKSFDWFKFHVEQNIVSFGTVEKRLAQVGDSIYSIYCCPKFHWWYVGTQHVQMQRDCNVKKQIIVTRQIIFVFSLACRCAERARQKGYTVFGLQFWGECWSAPNINGEVNFNRSGVALDKKCVMNLNKPTECVQSSDQECVGKHWTNYVYKLKEDGKLNDGEESPVIKRLLRCPGALPYKNGGDVRLKF